MPHKVLVENSKQTDFGHSAFPWRNLRIDLADSTYSSQFPEKNARRERQNRSASSSATKPTFNMVRGGVLDSYWA